MQWKDTGIECKFFNYNSFIYYRNYNKANDPFYESSWHAGIISRGFLYPKQDLSNVDNLRTTTINPESKLFFDQSSGFPRFKLGLTDNKRCIKVPKADYIVVSGEVNYSITSEQLVVIQDSKGVYIIDWDDWVMYFGSDFQKLKTQLCGYHTFEPDAQIIYIGRIQSYSKDSLYLAKYVNGEYTVPYITDTDLDKICCSMCPEPTYDEFLSIVDMLNSEDASVVQLGIKMLTGYNVEKYKLSFRLILCTRRNWYDWSRNLVACKQLLDTLKLDTYKIYDNFVSGAGYVQRGGETYDAEDIAIAKKLAAKFMREDLQNYLERYYISRGYEWLPDERTVELK